MVNNQEQMTISELKNYLGGLEPPKEEDLKNIREILYNWDDFNKVTDDDIKNFKRILNIPVYYKCTPVLNYADCIAIMEDRNHDLKILLFFNVNSPLRVMMHEKI